MVFDCVLQENIEKICYTEEEFSHTKYIVHRGQKIIITVYRVTMLLCVALFLIQRKKCYTEELSVLYFPIGTFPGIITIWQL